MRERLTTLVLALGALFLFLSLLFQGQAPLQEGAAASVPTTVDRAANGLIGARTWLEEEGVRTQPVRERFTELPRLRGVPSSGNLLIVTMPAATTFHNDEAVALDQWVRDGNTVLVLAALADRPAWARSWGILQSDLHLITGLDVELVRPGSRAGAAAKGDPEAAHTPDAENNANTGDATPEQQYLLASTPLAKPQRDTLEPNRPHPYLDGVQSAAAFSDYLPRHWKMTLARDTFPLCLAHVGASPDCALWLQTDGAGNLLVSAFSSLFSNRALGQADNARLLANLVRASVAADGVVLFDDEHQGLTDAYDPEKFYRDRRLYLTVGVIAAVWLVWVIGGTRLVVPPGAPAAQGEADLVRTTGSFLARVLRPQAAARRMFELFFLRLGNTLRDPTPDLAHRWDWLENNPRLARADVAQLRAWYADAYSARRVPLARLHNLIVKTERQIAA